VIVVEILTLYTSKLLTYVVEFKMFILLLLQLLHVCVRNMLRQLFEKLKVNALIILFVLQEIYKVVYSVLLARETYFLNV
jgi:hypothetical protein